MIKILPIFLSLIANANLLVAQEYKAVSNLESFKKSFRAHAAEIQTIQCDFTQTKTLSVLDEQLISSGEFLFKRTDKVKITYVKPFRYIMIVNGNQMLLKDGEKEGKVNMGSSKLLKQVNRIILDAVQGSILDNSNFTSTVYENAKAYKAVLTPKDKALREFFVSIALVIDRKDFTVTELTLTENGGDTSVMEFFNKKLNAEIANEIFVIH